MRILMVDARSDSPLDDAPARHLRGLVAALREDNEVTLARGALHHAGLRRLMLAKRPELVHIHGAESSSLLKIMRCLDLDAYRRVPVVMTLDDYRLRCLSQDLRHPDGRGCSPRLLCQLNLGFNRLLTSRIGLVHSPSQFMLDRHLERGFFRRADQLVLPYGRATPAATIRAAKDSYDILFLGSMHRADGAEILVRAFRRLPEPSLRLHLVGDGPAARSSRELAAGDARVVLHSSPTDEAWRDLMLAADCAVLPSLWPASASPRLTEALASNAVVVASRVGGIPEVLRDGVNGLLIEPGDEAAVAGAIERLRQSPGLAGRLRTEAGKTARLDDMAFRATRLTEAYRRLIATNQVSPFSRKAA